MVLTCLRKENHSVFGSADSGNESRVGGGRDWEEAEVEGSARW